MLCSMLISKSLMKGFILTEFLEVKIGEFLGLVANINNNTSV